MPAPLKQTTPKTINHLSNVKAQKQARRTHLRHLRLLLLLILQRILHILANRDRPDPILEPLPAKHGSKDDFRVLESTGRFDAAAALFLAVFVVYCAEVGVGEDLRGL